MTLRVESWFPMFYDVTYGIVQNEKDTLVLVDDSIVRGNYFTG